MFNRSVFLMAAAAMCLGLPESATAAAREIVGYRLKDWTTAEFEDTDKAEKHYKTLKKLGCDAGQGYLFGTPEPASMVTAALNESGASGKAGSPRQIA